MGEAGRLYGHWHCLFPGHSIHVLPCWLAGQHAGAGEYVKGKLCTGDGEMAVLPFARFGRQGS